MKEAPPARGVALSLKRLVDVIGALCGIVFLGPVMIAAAIAVRLKMGCPVLFRQARPGLAARPFTIYKFRTMAPPRDHRVWLPTDAERLTPLGAFLRKTSIDELPELFNVLRGDMSLVGPRPLLMEYLDRYTPEQMRRHEVKPGITGWAQVNGRNAITWEERFALDVWYVDHWSLWLDLKILLLTALKVIRREGISPEGQATMEEFMGTPRGRGC